MNGKMIKHNFKRRNYINYIHLSNFVQKSCVSGFDRGLCGSVAGKTTLDREVSNTQLNWYTKELWCIQVIFQWTPINGDPHFCEDSWYLATIATFHFKQLQNSKAKFDIEINKKYNWICLHYLASIPLCFIHQHY